MTAINQINNDEGTPKLVRTFATITGDVDLTSEVVAPGLGGKFARWITIATPGTLTLVNGPSGVVTTLPALPAGHREFGQFSAIHLAGTSAAGIIVAW